MAESWGHLGTRGDNWGWLRAGDTWGHLGTTEMVGDSWGWLRAGDTWGQCRKDLWGQLGTVGHSGTLTASPASSLGGCPSSCSWTRAALRQHPLPPLTPHLPPSPPASPGPHLLHQLQHGLEARPPVPVAVLGPLGLQVPADAPHDAVLRPVPLVLLLRQRRPVPLQPLGVL